MYDRPGAGSVEHKGQPPGQLGGVGCAAAFGFPPKERGQPVLLSTGDQTRRMLGRLDLDGRSDERTATEIVSSFEGFQPFEDMQNPCSRRTVVIIGWQQKGRIVERRAFPQAGCHQLILAAEQLVHRTLRHPGGAAQRVDADVDAPFVEQLRGHVEQPVAVETAPAVSAGVGLVGSLTGRRLPVYLHCGNRSVFLSGNRSVSDGCSAYDQR